MKNILYILILLFFVACNKVTTNNIEGSWELNYGENKWGNPQDSLMVWWTYENKTYTNYNGYQIEYIAYNYSFSKEGTYEIYLESKVNDTLNVHYIYIENGRWSVLGKDKINGFKKGKRIVLEPDYQIKTNVQQITGEIDTLQENLAGGFQLWHVEKINNKELILKYDFVHQEDCQNCDNYHRAMRLEFKKQ